MLWVLKRTEHFNEMVLYSSQLMDKEDINFFEVNTKYFSFSAVKNQYLSRVHSQVGVYPFSTHMRKFYLTYPIPKHEKGKNQTSAHRKTRDVTVMFK